MPVRIVIVDDQQLVRTGLATIISVAEDLDVVGEASDGAEGIEVVTRLEPDVVIMDIRMDGMDGLEATRTLVEGGSTSRVLMVTTYGNERNLFEAIRAGASGFLSKDTPADDLRDAIRVVASGNALLSPEATRQLIEAFAREPGAPQMDGDALTFLTEREREVLALLAQGKSNAEIAEQFFVASTTVKTHVSRVLSKLGLRDRAQAVIYAYENGIVRPRA